MRKYKCQLQQGVYDSCFAKGADDFMRRRGGALQCSFMDGYQGIKSLLSRSPKTSCAWAAYAAGMDRKTAELKGLPEAEVKNKRLLGFHR